VGEGLRAIEVRQPALVVLDLGLEDGSGLALLDRLRSSDGLASRLDPELPVMVLTGRAGEADGCTDAALGSGSLSSGHAPAARPLRQPPGNCRRRPVSVLQRELWVCREGIGQRHVLGKRRAIRGAPGGRD
jgi:CheY-like chemotaxis protein